MTEREAPRVLACRGPAARPGDVIRIGWGADAIEVVVLEVTDDPKHPDSHAYISYLCPDGSIGGGIFSCSTVFVTRPVGVVGNCADCLGSSALCDPCMGTGEAIGSRIRSRIIELKREQEILIDERDQALSRLDQWTGGDAA